jgi:hypothetical protein
MDVGGQLDTQTGNRTLIPRSSHYTAELSRLHLVWVMEPDARFYCDMKEGGVNMPLRYVYLISLICWANPLHPRQVLLHSILLTLVLF